MLKQKFQVLMQKPCNFWNNFYFLAGAHTILAN